MIGVNVNEFETKNLKERMDKEKMNWRSFAHQDAINAQWNPSTPTYYILDPKGKKLGRIVHGAPATTNLAFGGADWKTLYFTSRNHLGAVNVKIAGIPVPPPRK